MISALPPWSNSDNKRQQLQQQTTNPTTALEELRALAQRRGWLTVSAAAVTSGLLDRLGHAAAEHLNRAAEALGIALQDVTRLARLTPFADDDPPRSPTLAAPKHLTGWFTS